MENDKNITSCKRIFVTGSPSSGKSYFSAVLSNYLGIQVYHSDAIQNKLLKTKKNPLFIMKYHRSYIEKPEWIIDGQQFCEFGSFKQEQESYKRCCERADAILFFMFTPEDCMRGFHQRLKEMEAFDENTLPDRLRGANVKKPMWNKKGYFMVREPELLTLLDPWIKQRKVHILRNTSEVMDILKSIKIMQRGPETK